MLLLLALSLIQADTTKSWQRTDYLLAGTVTATMAADCITTAQSLQRGAVERNPFLGQQPGTFGVASVCVLTWGATMLVADALPRKYRRPLLATIAVVGLAVAIRNTTQQR